MYRIFESCDATTSVLGSLCVILLAGFLMTRITKRLLLPNVSGFILAGLLIGPSVLDCVPHQLIADMSFISDLALSFIAFDVGRFFKRETLRSTGRGVLLVTLLESLLAGALVTLATYLLFGMDLSFSLLLGAIATATAPASTMMTIDQYHARGEFVNVLLQVVALDDVICLLVFGVVTSMVSAGAHGVLRTVDVLLPLLCNLLAVVLGLVCGLLLCKLLAVPTRSRDNRIILVVAMLLGISGLCAWLEVSPLLACMVMGATYINLAHDKELYHQLKYFTPPIMSLFFIVSGMNLRLEALGAFGLLGVAYFFIRILGKYGGAFLGCALVGLPRNLRNYLGMALVPQAGVAIGLAFMGQRLLPPQVGSVLLTVILSSSVLYELVGPASAKAALALAGVIPHERLTPACPRGHGARAQHEHAAQPQKAHPPPVSPASPASSATDAATAQPASRQHPPHLTPPPQAVTGFAAACRQRGAKHAP